MSTLISGGRIITAADDYVGDVFVEDDRISMIGESLDVDADRVIDASGKYVLPGCVDPHTHLVFAGDRRDELRRRLSGATYAEIAASGGGIVKTVTATRAASEHELVDLARKRLAEMLAFGTTTAEVKSGYGLDLKAEQRMLRATRTVAAGQPIDLTATFMGESTQIAGRISGTNAVETAIGLVHAATTHQVGAEVVLIVRPENIRTDSAAIALGTARIREATFQGAHYRVLARAERGDQDFVLRLPPDHAVEQGAALRLSCRAESLVALGR